LWDVPLSELTQGIAQFVSKRDYTEDEKADLLKITDAWDEEGYGVESGGVCDIKSTRTYLNTITDACACRESGKCRSGGGCGCWNAFNNSGVKGLKKPCWYCGVDQHGKHAKCKLPGGYHRLSNDNDKMNTCTDCGWNLFLGHKKPAKAAAAAAPAAAPPPKDDGGSGDFNKRLVALIPEHLKHLMYNKGKPVAVLKPFVPASHGGFGGFIAQAVEAGNAASKEKHEKAIKAIEDAEGELGLAQKAAILEKADLIPSKLADAMRKEVETAKSLFGGGGGSGAHKVKRALGPGGSFPEPLSERKVQSGGLTFTVLEYGDLSDVIDAACGIKGCKCERSGKTCANDSCPCWKNHTVDTLCVYCGVSGKSDTWMPKCPGNVGKGHVVDTHIGKQCVACTWYNGIESNIKLKKRVKDTAFGYSGKPRCPKCGSGTRPESVPWCFMHRNGWDSDNDDEEETKVNGGGKAAAAADDDDDAEATAKADDELKEMKSLGMPPTIAEWMRPHAVAREKKKAKDRVKKLTKVKKDLGVVDTPPPRVRKTKPATGGVKRQADDGDDAEPDLTTPPPPRRSTRSAKRTKT
jgi:hypothetical protein